ncbi:META domain-containing protein [Leifsonia shinshuensis]|uniref:META domain-containing protein n=1 Tax=Leifsonia shinshuensis TaxID=150026 RepID=UPI00285C71FF|nr:META domain-containing protein [Leifsonia shinshuensis]MDR6971556.1 heat shock protein HslJ [Leifsonia shinshuensis]
MESTRRAGAAAIVVALLMLTGCTPQPSSDVPGKWGSTDPGEPNLIIDSDGSYTGSDGCNTMSGKGTISGTTIELGTVATTQKACADVDTWMSTAESGKADGNTMIVYDSSGKKIGTLQRND